MQSSTSLRENVQISCFWLCLLPPFTCKPLHASLLHPFHSKELVFIPCFLWTPGGHWRCLGAAIFLCSVDLQTHMWQSSLKESISMNDWPPPNKGGFTSRAWLSGPLLGVLLEQVLPSKLENSFITSYGLSVTFQEEINQFSSCSNCWSSWELVSIPPLSQELALPILLLVVAGGAKHQGSGEAGEGAVRGQVLASSAFLCSSCLAYDSCINCFVFCPSFPALGVFQIMAKMVRRTCAFCSEGEAGSVMYIAKERNIAAHQDCLVSGF